MGYKSITVDVEEYGLKSLHIRAIDSDVSRKAFIEEIIQVACFDEGFLKKVEESLTNKKSPAK